MFKKVASLVFVLGLAAPVLAQTEAAPEAGKEKAPKTAVAHPAKKVKAKAKKEAAATEVKSETPAPAEAAPAEAAPKAP